VGSSNDDHAAPAGSTPRGASAGARETDRNGVAVGGARAGLPAA
jgi:hypothetical protein